MRSDANMNWNASPLEPYLAIDEGEYEVDETLTF
jgi:hypothetical protein